MTPSPKPRLSFLQIWNMCFGFLGIQFGFALQNANVSRIFQTLGASVDEIPILWVAAPLTGLLVQPVVGYFSDRTKTRLGRRRPYFLVGAVLTTLALFAMPNSPTLWIAAGMLWIMDASINITMEPFRAFVGDKLPERQRPLGYVMQSFFIGVGAVVASALPYMLTQWFNVSNVAEPGSIPDTVRYAFYTGGVVLLLAVGWTVISSSEYSEEEMRQFHGSERLEDVQRDTPFGRDWPWWFSGGAVLTVLIFLFSWSSELYILSIGLVVYGLCVLFGRHLQQQRKTAGGFFQVIYDLNTMPETMKQLAGVQFFSWFALFAMWIYSTAAVSAEFFGATDSSSQAYNDGADWVGVLFAAYNGFAAIAAFGIAALANRIGTRLTHCVCLVIGSISFLLFFVIDSANGLLFAMAGVGVAWASILSLPYAMLANCIPQNRMGLYMGIFNFFIVIPQILAASILGVIVKTLFAGEAIFAFLLAALCWCIAAVLTFRIPSEKV